MRPLSDDQMGEVNPAQLQTLQKVISCAETREITGYNVCFSQRNRAHPLKIPVA